MSQPSARTAVQAWQGKPVLLVLLGRKHLNGQKFTEHYAMRIEKVTGPVSLAGAIGEALRLAGEQTDMPADLIEGVEFRILQEGSPA